MAEQRRRRPDPADLARRAALQLADLLGKPPESIISVQQADGVWQVGVEVVETRRVPDTSDILAEYQVDVDETGRLVAYHRARRYSRGRTGEHS
jgi:hypothetical protein